ncbi:MAG: class I tRNA ligase family protein, partial [Aquirufa sp.]
VNDLGQLKCHKKSVLRELVLLLSPYAPHMAEELWVALGEEPGSISLAKFPVFNPEFLVENEFNYPISFNGKVKLTLAFSATASPAEVEAAVLANEQVQKQLDGKAPSKVIVVPKRIVNIVLGK